MSRAFGAKHIPTPPELAGADADGTSKVGRVCPQRAAEPCERPPYRFGGRDFRLTDIHGQVIREILA